MPFVLFCFRLQLQELREETGIVIKDSELQDLTGLAWNLPSFKPGGGGAASPAASSASSSSSSASAASSTAAAAAAGEEVNKDKGMYPSVGGCDEFIRLMYYSKEVTREYLEDLKGKATGNIEEGEVITLDLLPYDDLWRRTSDSKSLSSILLYEKLLAAGSIKA